MASTGCLCVWASQCLAYICYHSWSVIKSTEDIYCGYVADILIISRLGAHRNNVRQTYPRLYRWGDESLAQSRSFGAYFQPAWAWFGLIASLTIVFVFNSASWWHGHITANELIAAYIGVNISSSLSPPINTNRPSQPAFLAIVWLFLKLFNADRVWCRHLGGWPKLNQAITRLLNTADENMLVSTDTEAQSTATPANSGQQRSQVPIVDISTANTDENNVRLRQVDIRPQNSPGRDESSMPDGSIRLNDLGRRRLD